VHVANALDMHVVAEGIERASQADVLAEIGCDTAQGYYFSRPQSAEAVEVFIGEQQLSASRAA
jgi:EAL domain-containing protein (putative c-di-GMP-specific phosphodiesterase class I)